MSILRLLKVQLQNLLAIMLHLEQPTISNTQALLELIKLKGRELTMVYQLILLWLFQMELLMLQTWTNQPKTL
jgi:hypothetical protein